MHCVIAMVMVMGRSLVAAAMVFDGEQSLAVM